MKLALVIYFITITWYTFSFIVVTYQEIDGSTKNDVLDWFDFNGGAVILVFLILLCLQPFIKCFYRRARYSLMIVLWNILIAPFGTVRFRDFFMADVITSMGTPISDIGYAIHQINIQRQRLGFLDYLEKPVWLNNYLIVISIIPFWFRFWQCIHKAVK